jgi:hypothetical protein
MGIYVFLVVGLVIVGAFLYFEAQRRDALAGVAVQLGLTFTGGLQRLPAELGRAGFYLFTQGAAECLNLMQGEHRGYRIALFGYGYDAPKGEEGSRDVPVGDAGQSERCLQTVLWAMAPGRTLGALDLSPTLGPCAGSRSVIACQPSSSTSAPTSATCTPFMVVPRRLCVPPSGPQSSTPGGGPRLVHRGARGPVAVLPHQGAGGPGARDGLRRSGAAPSG